jgi:glycosyltransferase involved in cell wall biosynthesis
MKETLFIGTYLSHYRGSMDVTENLAVNLKGEGIHSTLVSKKLNRFSRALDIFLNIFLFRGRVIVFDLFSGKSLYVTYVCLYLARLFNKRTMIVLHGGGLVDAFKINKFVINNLLQNADKLVSPSMFLIEFFKQQGFEIIHIPNSINLEYFPYKEKQTNEYKLLWIRAFAPVYNPQLAVLVLNQIRKKYPKAELTMIGPDFGELTIVNELIKSLNLGSFINIIGPIPNKGLVNYFHSHDIYLNTPKYESFGMALIEAGASGIPIVSTNVGEIPIIWQDKVNILLAKDDVIESLSLGIEKIFENQQFRMEMIKNARRNSEHYIWDNVKEKWNRVINELYIRR